MATAIDVSYRADISNLSKQLASIPGLTEKAAKDMVKGLESNIKKAERAAVRAAKNSQKAWGKTTGQFKNTRQATDRLSEGMENLKDQSGETDSVLKAFGGAIGTVSPEAERAFTVLGDLSGGVEALARSSIGLIGPIAMVTAAVGAGVFLWNKYSEELEEAEERAKAMAEATQEMATAANSFKVDQARINLEHAVSAGEKHIDVLRRVQAEEKARATTSNLMGVELKRLETAQDAYNLARLEEVKLSKDSRSLISGDHAAAQKAAQEALVTLNARKRTVKTLQKEEENLADLIFKTGQNNRAATAAAKQNSKATKDQTDAIGDLIAKVNAFDPPVSEFAQMDQLLEAMTDAAFESQEAFERLQPAIGRLVENMERLEDAKASEELKKLSQAAAKFGGVADPIADASDMLARLKTEAQKSDAAFEALAPDIQRVGQHLEGLKAGEASAQKTIRGVRQIKAEIENLEAQQKSYEALHGTTSDAIEDRQRQLTAQLQTEADKIRRAYTDAFNNMAAAGAQFADLRVSQLQKQAQAELESREQISENLENALSSLNSAIDSAETEAEAARLQKMRSNLEARLQQEKEHQEKVKEIKDKQILKAFRASQAFNVAQALMNSAVAVTKALADLGPVAGLVAASSIGVLTAAQVATIAAQEPPTAHTGGMVGNSDERLIKARTGEGVLTAQGVQAIGGAQGVANANAGMAPGSGQIVIQQVYRHRVLDTVIQDSINKGGPISQAINRRNRRGRRNPYRRSG